MKTRVITILISAVAAIMFVHPYSVSGSPHYGYCHVNCSYDGYCHDMCIDEGYCTERCLEEGYCDAYCVPNGHCIDRCIRFCDGYASRYDNPYYHSHFGFDDYGLAVIVRSGVQCPRFRNTIVVNHSYINQHRYLRFDDDYYRHKHYYGHYYRDPHGRLRWGDFDSRGRGRSWDDGFSRSGSGSRGRSSDDRIGDDSSGRSSSGSRGRSSDDRIGDDSSGRSSSGSRDRSSDDRIGDDSSGRGRSRNRRGGR